MTDVQQHPSEHAPPELPVPPAEAALPPVPPRQPDPTLITYIERGIDPETVRVASAPMRGQRRPAQ